MSLFAVSPNLLTVLGVRLQIGRDVAGDEEVSGRARVAWISDETWQRRFGADPEVLGRAFGTTTPIRIIGVLPRGFVPPAWVAPSPTWDGLATTASAIGLAPLARLRPGATPGAAEAELTGLVARLAPELRDPRTPPGAPPPFVRVDALNGTLFERLTDHAWLVWGAALMVLILSCASLSGLMLARAGAREREVAVRMALGASARRVMGASVIEAALVCAAGLVVALGTLALTGQALEAMLPPLLARYATGLGDLRLLGASALVAMTAVVATSLVPGLRLSRVPPDAALVRTASGARRTRIRGGGALVVAETTVGALLVSGAALTGFSVSQLVGEGVGYRPEGLYRLTIAPPSSTTPAPRLTGEEELAQYERRLEASASVPGVVAVAGGDSVVSSGAGPMRAFASSPPVPGGRYEVSAGYFAAIGATVVAGREFRDEDVRARGRVAMLDVRGASAMFPGVALSDVVGRPIELGAEPPRQIIGIVAVLRAGYGSDTRPALFLPLGAEPRFYREWLVRTTDGQPPSHASLTERLAPVGGGGTVRVAAADAQVAPTLRDPTFRVVLFAAFALVALVVAGTAQFALASFDVALRRYEMGVRLALGARPAMIRGLVVRSALRPVLLGLTLAVPLAYWAASYLEPFLYRTNARSPWVLVAVSVAFVGLAMAAVWGPARRAAMTDPVKTLRADA